MKEFKKWLDNHKESDNDDDNNKDTSQIKGYYTSPSVD